MSVELEFVSALEHLYIYLWEELNFASEAVKGLISGFQMFKDEEAAEKICCWSPEKLEAANHLAF